MYLRCFTSSEPKDWANWLSWAEFCHNTSSHSAIKTTSFEVVYMLTYVSQYCSGWISGSRIKNRDSLPRKLKHNLKEHMLAWKKYMVLNGGKMNSRLGIGSTWDLVLPTSFRCIKKELETISQISWSFPNNWKSCAGGIWVRITCRNSSAPSHSFVFA